MDDTFEEETFPTYNPDGTPYVGAHSHVDKLECEDCGKKTMRYTYRPNSDQWWCEACGFVARIIRPGGKAR
jgi:ribosomal protein L37E